MESYDPFGSEGSSTASDNSTARGKPSIAHSHWSAISDSDIHAAALSQSPARPQPSARTLQEPMYEQPSAIPRTFDSEGINEPNLTSNLNQADILAAVAASPVISRRHAPPNTADPLSPMQRRHLETDKTLLSTVAANIVDADKLPKQRASSAPGSSSGDHRRSEDLLQRGETEYPELWNLEDLDSINTTLLFARSHLNDLHVSRNHMLWRHGSSSRALFHIDQALHAAKRVRWARARDIEITTAMSLEVDD